MKDVARRLRVYSRRDRRLTEIDAIFAHDLNGQCWISAKAVERLELWRRPISRDEYGVLARRTFNFCGVVTLEWIDDGQTKPTKCNIVPSNVGIEFDVFFERSMLPLTSAQGSAINIPRVISNYAPPSVEDSSPPAIGFSADYTGSFDGDGLEEFAEFMDDNSNEYCILLIRYQI